MVAKFLQVIRCKTGARQMTTPYGVLSKVQRAYSSQFVLPCGVLSQTAHFFAGQRLINEEI